MKVLWYDPCKRSFRNFGLKSSFCFENQFTPPPLGLGAPSSFSHNTDTTTTILCTLCLYLSILFHNDLGCEKVLYLLKFELPKKIYKEIFIRRNLHQNRSFLTNNIRMHLWCTFRSSSKLFLKMGTS